MSSLQKQATKKKNVKGIINIGEIYFCGFVHDSASNIVYNILID